MSGRLRSTIPHIDQLPCESMRDIFFMTLLGLSGEHPDHPRVETMDGCSLVSKPYQGNTFLPPLHISHVSRRWRELFISFGELWSYLSIKFTHLYTSKSILAVTEVFDTFLERTNGPPLHFRSTFSPNGPSDPRVDRAAEHILTALLKEQKQRKDIVLDLKYLEVSPSFLGIYTHFKIGQSTFVRRLDLKGLIKLDAGVGLMTALKDCKLSFCDYPEYIPVCMKILKSAPNLRHLTIGTDADFGHVFESADLPSVEA